MKTKNNTSGITLVALIVTIIILLILAGISIASLTGNGLFEKAKLAKEEQDNAQIEEESTLEDYENKIGKYVDGTGSINTFLDYDFKNATNTNNLLSVTQNSDSTIYYICKYIYFPTNNTITCYESNESGFKNITMTIFGFKTY